MRIMKKGVALILVLLISYVSASQMEVTSFIFQPENPQSGDSVTILVRLTNKTYEEDVNVTCRLFIDGNLHDVKIVPVDRRSSSTVSFMWLAKPGNHLFSLELSSYVQRTEYTDTFIQYLLVPGPGQEDVDYYAKALELYDAGSFTQAKIMFEQAKRSFEENQNTEKALACEEYIKRCDQYVEATQLVNQAERAYQERDFPTALTYYQQAKAIYESLNDTKASLCEEKIQTIQKEMRKKADYTYYLLFLLPVVAAVIAFVWLRRKKPPPELPEYVPERSYRPERREPPQRRERLEPPPRVQKEKKLFTEDDEKNPPLVKELHRIESQLDTTDPGTFKSLAEDFKKQEILFKKKEYSQEETTYIERSMGEVKEKIKEKGKRLQDIQKLKELHKRIDVLVTLPLGDLLEAYNRYAQLQNAFSQIPELDIPEQEEVRGKLRDFYSIIQQQAKTGQFEMQ